MNQGSYELGKHVHSRMLQLDHLSTGMFVDAGECEEPARIGLVDAGHALSMQLPECLRPLAH